MMNLQTELKELNGKRIFITGATGLIGHALISALMNSLSGTFKVIACVRDMSKAIRMFGEYLGKHFEMHCCDVCDLKPIDNGIDYIIHCASMTTSKDFVQRPVDVIETSVVGTKNILEYARINNVKAMIYLSTMEVYGAPTADDVICETSANNIDTADVRSSYPESKRLCENLCVAYMKQYNVPINVIRLTQTFGEGVSYNDSRVFAEFARCAIEGKNIILKTKGETRRNYLYINDAITAILTVILRGVRGEIYNAANENTYCSIFEMAKLVADNFGNGKVNVIIRESDITKFGYAPKLKMNLSSRKLQELGWTPKTDLKEMFGAMIEYMRDSIENA